MTFDEANDWIAHRQSKTTELTSREISKTVPPKIAAHCFFSAQVAKENVLGKIRDVSDRFSRGEISQADARSELRNWLKANNQDDGTASVKNLASKARVNLILEQNKKMAVAVGRYQTDRDPVVEARFPAWEYHTGRNPRDAHAALNGKIYLKSDPIWQKIYPPWEFGCNCWVTNTDKAPNGTITVADIGKPTSGYRFDPSDAFEDYKVDSFEFKKTPDSPLIVKARGEAETLRREQLKIMYKDVDKRQPGIVEEADDYWGRMEPEDREPVIRYTASDQASLNRASRGQIEMTKPISDEMDKVSTLLEKAPKYTGGQVYRVINLNTQEDLKSLVNDLENDRWALNGFNSTSTSMDSAKRYLNPEKTGVVFHVVKSRNGAFIGQYSYMNADKEVLFDRKCKFRALQSWEPDYIKRDGWPDGLMHIAIMEV